MSSKKTSSFDIFINVILFTLAVFIILPFIILFMSSFASERSLIESGYKFVPTEFSLNAYRYILGKSNLIFRSYTITIVISIIGTATSLIITTMLAYPLSRQDFSKRNVFTFIVLFTMLFNGGFVPSYIIWTRVFHIKNTLAALIIPNLLLNGFSVLLVRNYFRTNIPPQLIEAAKIDSAGEFRIFFKIALPLSTPILATLGLLTGLTYWNDWVNGLYYITESQLFSIQVLLNRILMDIQFLLSESNKIYHGRIPEIPSVSVRMAIAVLGIIPIMIIYPFLQKYFVKGITLGSVKG